MTTLTTSKLTNHLGYEITRWDGAQDDFDLNSFRYWQAVQVQASLASIENLVAEWTDQELMEYQVELALDLWSDAHQAYRDSDNTSFFSSDMQFTAKARASGQAAVADWFGQLVVGRTTILTGTRR